MKILITGGNSAKALKLLKAFPNHFVLLGDYGDVPSVLTEKYGFASFGTLNKESIAHIFLNFCITESIDCIIPLKEFELEPLAKSAVLFDEYNIQVLLPDAAVIADFIDQDNQAFANFAIFIDGTCIYSTAEIPGKPTHQPLNGIYGYNENSNELKLFTI
ncbi:ATP-grasp domain-containing protein [Pedobacter rhizosphaerae]|uniref:Uncharacterized protein n=1 Tax=Pedobacter rhizosphaerae TaxID=390241 RepID=A0A1H9SQP5_9SPHI|nr:hypothetical protein [Pedobacter rhizosphaerae]SER87342.1 hypothetical protein SAMN04488023_11931 [Pedobacter rhizosphaerae]